MSRLRSWYERSFRNSDSRLFRDAFWIFLFSITSKGLLFFGMAHAARCLGPVNLGISAQVQVLSQQIALLFNGGIDSVGLRNIAVDKNTALPTLASAVKFRLGTASILALVWIVAVLATFEPGSMRNVWLLGAPLLIVASLNTTFVYQAVGKLPLYTAIFSLGTVISAAIYLLYFKPGITLGADLFVSVPVAIASALTALVACKLLLHGASTVEDAPTSWGAIGVLLVQGWRYWLLAVVIYAYAGFPLLVVSYFHGDRAAGVFRAALLMAAAVELLFSSVNSLLLPRLVAWNRDGAKNLWLKQTHLLPLHFAVGLGAGGICIATAPIFFDRFLGAQYENSIAVFQFLVLGRMVVFIGQIYAFGLVALHLDAVFLRATLIGAVLSLLANVILVPAYGAIGAALISVLVEFVICLQYYLLEKRHVFAASS